MITPPPAVPGVGIDRLTIRGVDATTAARLGPALERALADRAPGGATDIASLQLRLPHGVTAADIAAALAAAMARGG